MKFKYNCMYFTLYVIILIMQLKYSGHQIRPRKSIVKTYFQCIFPIMKVKAIFINDFFIFEIFFDWVILD